MAHEILYAEPYPGYEPFEALHLAERAAERADEEMREERQFREPGPEERVIIAIDAPHPGQDEYASDDCQVAEMDPAITPRRKRPRFANRYREY
ncbi:hypothetical protein MAIT1_03813 [Magnetofaba australis IT-1]|uniref:Uncharacterized protein n=2 Tax=Magnetofaba TaxID=1472292 RepID=A0A1Y2K950_9PROT|nr:hypothetical protein MAIT1_03813 [Magnetofaba australis IT-1]